MASICKMEYHQFDNNISKSTALISSLIGIIFLFIGASFLSCIGIGLVAYSIGLIIKDSNSYFMPFELMIIIMAGIQWIVAPTICYLFGSILYQMSVPESQYMIYTLLMYLPLYIAMLSYHRKRKLCDINDLSDFCSSNLRLTIWMITIGLISIFIRSQSFFITLFSILYYIGIVMLMLSNPQKSVLIMIVGIFPLLIRSLSSAMFHDLLIWGMVFILTLFYIKKFTLFKRLGIFIGLLVLVVLLQTIKAEYRSSVWFGSGHNESNIELFANLMVSKASSKTFNHTLLSVNDRFNQGWIISRIYSHIPTETEYKGGKTILEGIETALLPRFISSSRKNKGEDSRRDFIDFTGVHINSNTSMGLSIIGEAYGNFGPYGGFLFMIVWSFILTGFFNLISRLSINNPLWLCLLPMICFTLIKAETNFLSIINWTVKALIFAYLLVSICQHFNFIIFTKHDRFY